MADLGWCQDDDCLTRAALQSPLIAKVTKPRLLFFPSRARNQGRGWVTRIPGQLTFEDEALLDGPQLREEVLQLRPARLQGQVGHLCTADVAQLSPSTVSIQTGGCVGKGSIKKIYFFPRLNNTGTRSKPG